MVLDERGGSVQPAVGLDRHRLDAAAAVIGYQNRLAGFVDRDMARAVAAGRLLIQGSERACTRINGESAHGAALFAAEFADFIGRKEKFLVGMNGEKTRAGRLGGQFHYAGFAAGRVEARDVNPLALRAGVSAEINKKLFCVWRGGRGLRAGLRGAATEKREHPGKCDSKPVESFHAGIKQGSGRSGKNL